MTLSSYRFHPSIDTEEACNTAHRMNWSQVLKQDISATRLRALAPLISGTAGVEYMRKAFSTRYQLEAGVNKFTEITQRLPNTLDWFTEGLQSIEQEKSELEASLAPVQSTLPTTPAVATGLPPPSSMRTGGRIGVTSGLAAAVPTAGSPLHPPGCFQILRLL